MRENWIIPQPRQEKRRVAEPGKTTRNEATALCKLAKEAEKKMLCLWCLSGLYRDVGQSKDLGIWPAEDFRCVRGAGSLLTEGLAWSIPKKKTICAGQTGLEKHSDVNWLKRVPGERQLFKDDPAGQFMGSLAYGAVGVLLNAALPAAK